jgi:hypothetical protein
MRRGRAEIERTIGKKGRVLDVMEEMGTRQEILTEVNKVDLDGPIIKNDLEEEMNLERVGERG